MADFRRKRMDLEHDLLESWEKIINADHLVWIFPVWGGGLPAITKGFIDRLFLPSMPFSYYDNSNRMRGNMQNKTARIVTTLDQAGWNMLVPLGSDVPSKRKASAHQGLVRRCIDRCSKDHGLVDKNAAGQHRYSDG